MRNSKQKTAAVLVGSVALASGAYALGSQTDGNAVADGDRPVRFAGGPGYDVHLAGPPGLERLADRLGVSEDALRDALEDVRGSVPGPREVRADFAKELADELGTSEAKVEAALERIRGRHEQELEDRADAVAEALAKRLNLDADKVEDALEAPRLFMRPGP
jgi:Clp amino terminal domain, pathogenicity island component